MADSELSLGFDDAVYVFPLSPINPDVVAGCLQKLIQSLNFLSAQERP